MDEAIETTPEIPISIIADESPAIEPVKSEPPKEDLLRAELDEERQKREALEKRLNELVEENRRTRAKAEEADRQTAIRTELQRLGVAKVDLAFRAVKEDILRTDDGRLIAKTASGEEPMRSYLRRFLEDNPELLPARITGGSGASPAHRNSAPRPHVDLDRIKPGMSSEELDQVRQEIIRVANQTFRGY